MTTDNESKINEVLSNPPKSVRFNYIKSTHFRVIHVDGAYGGLTGHGFIHAAVYSERPTIPQVTEAEFTEGGMSAEQPIERRVGIVREIEADLVMNLETARAFRKWLDDKIDALEKAIEAVVGR